MRDIARRLIASAQTSGDRTGAEGRRDMPTRLGEEVLRLARLAAAVHLASQPRTATPICPRVGTPVAQRPPAREHIA